MNATTLKDLQQAIEVRGLPEPTAGMRPAPDDMLTTTELAARLKQATRTVERWHRKGVVLGIKVDGVVMFYWPSVVARLLERNQEREKEPRKDQRDTKGLKAATPQTVTPHSPSGHLLPMRRGEGPIRKSGEEIRKGSTQRPDSTPHPGPLPDRGG